MDRNDLRKQFEQETGKGCEIPDFKGQPITFTEYYVKWLEDKVKKYLNITYLTNSKVYNSGDRVELLDTGEKGTVWITNGRWLNVKLDNGVTWRGETDQIKPCI